MKTIGDSSGGLRDFRSHWFIFAVLLFSVLIRIHGIDANLPNIYWHDEINTVEGALRLGSGNFTPQTLQHGMLLPLMLAGEYGVYYVSKKAAGIYSTPADLLREYIHDPSNFYLISRITIGLFGIACIFLIYLIALKLYNKFVANLSSLFFSVSFMSITHSKWTKDDLVATFFILLGFLVSLRILFLPHEKEKGIWRYYIMSGFFIGLATAAKLNAVFSIIVIIVAHICMYRTNNPDRKTIYCVSSLFDFNMIISVLAAIIGFIAGNPYVIINPYFFCTTIATLNKEMIDPGRNSYLLYFTDHLKDVIGSRYLEIFALIACMYFIFKWSRKTTLLLAYPVVLYLFYMNYPGFAHYLIPALPFLFILTAAFIHMLYNKMTNMMVRTLLWVVVLIALIPCFLNILRYGALISKPDTRTLAQLWIEKNIPRNSVILSEGYISTAPIHVPQLKGNLNTLHRDMALVKSSGGSGVPVQEEIKFAGMDKASARYDIYKTRTLGVEDLARDGDNYIVLTGYSDIDLAQREFLRSGSFFSGRKIFYDRLNKEYVLIKEFIPYPEFGPFFPIFVLGDLKKLEAINPIFGTQPLLQGPAIRIYHKRSV